MAKQIEVIWDRYKSLSIAKRATLWITLSGFIQRGISFITVPIFTHLLSTAEYGHVSNYFSWSNIAYTVILLGCTYGGFNNGMIRYESDREGYTVSVAGLTTAMALVWLALGLLFPGTFVRVTGLSWFLNILLIVEVLVKAYFDVWMCRQRFDFAYRKVVAGSLFLAVFAPALGVALVLLSRDKVLARIIAYVLVEAVIGFFALIYMTKRSKRFIWLDYWKFTLSFNLPLIPYYLSQTAISQADVVMLTRFESAAAAGVFSLANSCAMVIMILVQSINSVLTPWIYHRMEEHEYKSVMKRATQLLFILGAGVVLLESLAPEVLAILAPSKYLSAVDAIPPITTSAFFILMYSLCVDSELFFEKTAYASASSVAIAILKVVLNLVLIPLFGYLGAAYGTLVCYSAMAAAHCLISGAVCRKQVSVAVYSPFVFFVMGFTMIAASLVLALLYPYPVVRVAIVLFLFVMAIWKRKLIIEIIRR